MEKKIINVEVKDFIEIKRKYPEPIINEEMKNFIENPANRMLIEINMLKKHFYTAIKSMDRLKNINHKKTIDIFLKNIYSGIDLYKLNDQESFMVSAMAYTMSDYILSVYKWKKWKKIYTFNNSLGIMLNKQADNTNPYKLNIPMDFLTHLPYETFYVSTNCILNGIESSKLNNAYGFFVKIDNSNKRKTLLFTVPVGDYYIEDENGNPSNIESYSSSNFISETYELVLEGGTIGECIDLSMNEEKVKFTKCDNNYKKITMRCLTYLMYILTSNADIVDGSVNTYKPKKKKISISDIISEIQTFDVGYRIGAALKRYVQQSESASIGSGKKKIPHTRRGHWHHYWTGPRNSDNRKLIVHWIPPIAVNSNWELENPIAEITPAK